MTAAKSFHDLARETPEVYGTVPYIRSVQLAILAARENGRVIQP
jgi:hypothetical protein